MISPFGRHIDKKPTLWLGVLAGVLIGAGLTCLDYILK